MTMYGTRAGDCNDGDTTIGNEKYDEKANSCGCQLTEICDNGKDDDCNGETDCGDWKCATEHPCCGEEGDRCCSAGLQCVVSGLQCDASKHCVMAPTPTCTDGIKNQDEVTIDCGGVCVGKGGSTACPNGPDSDGWYCGKQSLGQDHSKLYYCSKGTWDGGKTKDCGVAGCLPAGECMPELRLHIRHSVVHVRAVARQHSI